MSTFHTTGIVLAVDNTGEGDRRIWLYTEEFGKLELFAKSARRLTSKLSPHIEPFSVADCYVVRGRIDHLAGIERRLRFSGIEHSFDRLIHAAWGAELVHRLTKPDHPEPRIFSLIVAWLTFVDRTPEGNVLQRFRAYFVIRLFEYLGYRQEFTHCLRCQTTTGGEWHFAPGAGGITCRACAHEDEARIVLAEADRAALCDAGATHQPFSAHLRHRISEELARALITSLVASHLDRPLFADILFQSGEVVRA